MQDFFPVAVHRIRGNGQHGQGGQARSLPDLARHRKTIEYRHADVEQQNVQIRLLSHEERLLAIACFEHGISASLEQLAEQFAVHGAVFGNEDSGHDCAADFASVRCCSTLSTSTTSCFFQEPFF